MTDLIEAQKKTITMMKFEIGRLKTEKKSNKKSR